MMEAIASILAQGPMTLISSVMCVWVASLVYETLGGPVVLWNVARVVFRFWRPSLVGWWAIPT